MLDIIDWSKERPRHNDLDRYILEVQKAVPKTKFVYHVVMSGSSSMLKELFIDLSQQGQVHLVSAVCRPQAAVDFKKRSNDSRHI